MIFADNDMSEKTDLKSFFSNF